MFHHRPGGACNLHSKKITQGCMEVFRRHSKKATQKGTEAFQQAHLCRLGSADLFHHRPVGAYHLTKATQSCMEVFRRHSMKKARPEHYGQRSHQLRWPFRHLHPSFVAAATCLTSLGVSESWRIQQNSARWSYEERLATILLLLLS